MFYKESVVLGCTFSSRPVSSCRAPLQGLSKIQFQPHSLPLVHFCGEEIPKQEILHASGSLMRSVG